MSQNEVVRDVHLFIGGPLDGKLRRVEMDGNQYLMVPEIRVSGRVHHVYEFEGYALIYRGMNQTIGIDNGRN